MIASRASLREMGKREQRAQCLDIAEMLAGVDLAEVVAHLDEWVRIGCRLRRSGKIYSRPGACSSSRVNKNLKGTKDFNSTMDRM